VNATASVGQIYPKSLFTKGFLVLLRLFPDVRYDMVPFPDQYPRMNSPWLTIGPEAL
jgi:hypothetical protein